MKKVSSLGKKRLIAILLAAIVAVGFIGAGVYSYINRTNDTESTTTTAAKKSTSTTTNKKKSTTKHNNKTAKPDTSTTTTTNNSSSSTGSSSSSALQNDKSYYENIGKQFAATGPFFKSVSELNDSALKTYTQLLYEVLINTDGSEYLDNTVSPSVYRVPKTELQSACQSLFGLDYPGGTDGSEELYTWGGIGGTGSEYRAVSVTKQNDGNVAIVTDIYQNGKKLNTVTTVINETSASTYHLVSNTEE